MDNQDFSELLQNHPEFATNDSISFASLLAQRARRPLSVQATGLSEHFLADLLVKHLHEGGVLTIQQLSQRMKLAGAVVEEILGFLRKEARVEVRAKSQSSQTGLCFGLTDKGRHSALDALHRSGYTGPTPVPLEKYIAVAKEQSVHSITISRARMMRAFSNVIIEEEMLDRLGPALNSGRAIFVYGPAGAGKTYITQRLARAFDDDVLIPHAIAVNETVISLYDPLLHRVTDDSLESTQLMLEGGYDPRFVRCQRPVVISGGELTLEMLEASYDPATRQYQAPLQLKANNGMFIIDDLGRQRMPPKTLLNRWIVPMEEAKDYLTLADGKHFEVPFDEVLVFSTNLDPLDLADEAFLRRIGYKIGFDFLTREAYSQVWQEVCERFGLMFDPDILLYVLHELHGRNQVPLLPCMPRDLLNLARDRIQYLGEERITQECMDWAWTNYFVKLDADN